MLRIGVVRSSNTRSRALSIVLASLGSVLWIGIPTAALARDGAHPELEDMGAVQSAPKQLASSHTNTPPSEAPAKGEQGKKLAVAAIDEFISQQDIDKSKPGWKTSLPKPPQVAFDPSKTYFWNLETNVGSMKLKFYSQDAPMHVSSTIYLTQLGFYDDVLFHRVISGFMAQGGDPLGKGFGGPGYKYAGEFGGPQRHDKPGLLSMANAGPGTDGSQFFITFVPTPHLDGKHTHFGEIVEGSDTLKKLEDRGSRSGRPSETLKIVKATISQE